MLKLNSGIKVPKDHPNIDGIMNDLIRSVSKFNGGYTDMQFFIEHDNFIIVPRFYPINEDVEDINEDKVIEKREDYQPHQYVRQVPANDSKE